LNNLFSLLVVLFSKEILGTGILKVSQGLLIFIKTEADLEA